MHGAQAQLTLFSSLGQYKLFFYQKNLVRANLRGALMTPCGHLSLLYKENL